MHEADYHARYMIKSLLIVKLVYMHLVSALFVHPVMNKTCAALRAGCSIAPFYFCAFGGWRTIISHH